MNEPKYQWSKFAGPNRDEQFVVREDEFEAFTEARKNILSAFFSSSPAQDVTPVESKKVAPIFKQWDGEKPKSVGAECEQCGATAVERQGTSKSGKPYHGIFCSTEDKSHTKWIQD